MSLEVIRMIKRKIKILIIMIKCIFHIDGWEWFSPWVREQMERDPDLWR